MIADLIALLFFSRDYAHRAHLAAVSLSAHLALEAFYEDLTEATDKLTETWQGQHGKRLKIGYVREEPDVMDPEATLNKHLLMVQKMRYDAVPKEHTMLQNQIDEIEAIYAKALYKLKFLK